MAGRYRSADSGVRKGHGIGSGKVGVPRLSDQGEEFVQSLVGLKCVTAQLVHRADRVGTGSAPDQFLQRDQIFAASLALMFSMRAHRTYLMIVQLRSTTTGY